MGLPSRRDRHPGPRAGPGNLLGRRRVGAPHRRRVQEVPIPAFQQQVDRLVSLGYPALAGLDEVAFCRLVEPLRTAAETLAGEDTPGRVPFVLVVTRELVAPEATVRLLRLWGPRGPGSKPGRIDRHHGDGDLAGYLPIEGCEPPGPAYLLVGVERGEEFCNVTPERATRSIRARGRTPLTIEEGIALVTQVPQALERNRCFTLAGSRRQDRRVPALWISERAPKLGWCWEGNPHTWLGTASAAGRATAAG